MSAVDDAISVNADFLREIADEITAAGVFGEDDEEFNPYADDSEEGASLKTLSMLTTF